MVLLRSLPVLLLLLFILLITKSAFSSSLLHPLCHHDESSALLQLKNSFVISKHASVDDSVAYPKTLSWKPHDNCCLWDGVECESKTGHVIGLDLSSSYLYGSITSHSTLFSLVHLQKLHLGDNDFNFSRIPDELARLTALLYLNLSSAVFYGQVPQGISKLSKLVLLDLSLNLYSDNPLLQLKKSTFTRLVKNLTHLKELRLHYMYIPYSLPSQLPNLSSLIYLGLYNCSLQGAFLQEIFQLPKLQVLDVGENTDLTGELPEFVSTSQLNILQLEHTNFSGSLPTSIGNLASLTSISIRGCMFQGPIPSSLGNLTNLEYLDLRSNKFTGPIPSSLANLTQLILMAVSENNLRHENYNWLYGHPKLDSLELAGTNLVGPFPSVVRNLTELTLLDLSANQLTGHVPSWLTNLTQLTIVELGRNRLEGLIPWSIRNLYNLRYFNLGRNKFGGTLSLDTFSNMTKLEHLDLGYNNLSLRTSKNITNSNLKGLFLDDCDLRKFPTFILNLDGLRFLDLGENNIGGAIPEWLWKAIRNIQLLRLSGNDLTGTISPSICNLHYLNILEVLDNNLSGSLPQCLGSLKSDIQVLDFSANSFEGNISWLFARGNTLRMIDLSHNQLSGQIPRSLVNCSILEKLDLSFNQINDTFPSWLGGLSQLQVLGLRSNQLHGNLSIPATNFYFPSLRIIDLSHNKLIGELPVECFEMWTSMIVVQHDLQDYMRISLHIANIIMGLDYTIELGIKGRYFEDYKIQTAMVSIDLSNNKFDGQIPKSLGALQALILLNISNNQFSGSIPESMGNLANIQAMDLSNNMLSGQIPQQLATPTFLAVFDVSDNNLVGPIPQGTQFDTFPNTSFLGNPGLCGRALSIPCLNQTRLPRTGCTTHEEEEEEDSNSMIKWVIISLGFGSGVVIGVVLGNIFYDKNKEWLLWHISGQMTTRRTRRKVNKPTGMDQGQRLQPTAGKLVKVPELNKDSLEVQLGSVQTRPRAEEDELSSNLLEPGILEEGEIREIEKGKQPIIHEDFSSSTSS